jgi:tripartite-type tricarboxylate transporter receptor subunit TctC
MSKMTVKKLELGVAIVTAIILVTAPLIAFGQEYPNKPINLTIASGVGGTVDLSGRVLASKAEKILGKPIVVTNNHGGAGSIAIDFLVKAKPDGYQIVSTPHTPLIEIPNLRKISYKLDDVVPIMQYGEPQSGLVVRADAPWKTFKELIEYARKNPGKVTYTIGGTLNPFHLAMMYVAKQENIQWTAVPVPTGDPNMPLLGGHVTAFSSTTSWKRYVDAGQMRLLVTYGDKRIPAFPDIPTLKELGYDFVNSIFYLIVAPSGTPALIVKKLEDAYRKAMDDPEFIEYMKKADIKVAYLNSADTKKHLEEANKRFEKMMVELKIPKEQ